MRWNKNKVFLAAGLLLAFAGLGLPASSSHNPVLTAQASVFASAPYQEPSPTSSGSSAQPSPARAEHPNSGPPPFFVMIDPGHGGDDRGATFGGKIAEKDITLALGRRLKSELHERGVNARLSRDADITLSLEQRAESANEQHAAIYVALHAGMPGPGVRVYAPALVSPFPSSAATFVTWESAQTKSLPRSQKLAQRIAAELEKRNLEAATLASPLRPLNNIAAPAVAVELAPDSGNIAGSMSQKLQITLASAIAAAIVQLRQEMGEQP